MLRALSFFLALSALAGLGAIYACSTAAPTTGYSPVTGILLRVDSLIAGHGCGTGPDQVYKYAVVVVNSDGAVIPNGAGIYDCFSDGVFANLPPAMDGGTSFTLQVYAYDYGLYSLTQGDLQTAVNALSAGQGPGATAPIMVPATWTTTCQATQEANIQVLALCQPLEVETPPGPGYDGGSDAGIDGAADAARDAPADGPDADVLADAPTDASEANSDAPDAPIDAADADASGDASDGALE